MPVRCPTGVVAGPFDDVTGRAEPTGRERSPGIRLPDPGPFSSDNVGYGLAIAAVALALGTGALVAGRRLSAEVGVDRL